MARALARNEIRTAERRLDGCFYVWKMVPLPEEDATILYLTDITDRRQAEAELLQSQLFIARINDTVPSLVFLFDLDQQALTYCNRQAELLLGYTEAELKDMGSTVVERMVLPADREALRQQQPLEAAFLQPNQPATLDMRLRHRNGAWRWFRVQLTPFLRQPDGTASQLIGSAQDITKRPRNGGGTAPQSVIHGAGGQHGAQPDLHLRRAPERRRLHESLRRDGPGLHAGGDSGDGGRRGAAAVCAQRAGAAAGATTSSWAPPPTARCTPWSCTCTTATARSEWLRCNNTPFERDPQGAGAPGTRHGRRHHPVEDSRRAAAPG